VKYETKDEICDMRLIYQIWKASAFPNVSSVSERSETLSGGPRYLYVYICIYDVCACVYVAVCCPHSLFNIWGGVVFCLRL
jgi:hypothetical protein